MIFALTAEGSVYSIEIQKDGTYRVEDIISNSVICLALDGGTLYTGWEDNTIRLIDVETKNSSKILFGHQTKPQKLLCTNGVLFSSSNEEVRIWNASSGECREILVDENLTSSFYLIFSENFGATLLSLSSEARKYYERNVNEIVRSIAIEAALESLEIAKNIQLNLESCSMDTFPDIKKKLSEKVKLLNISKNRLTKLTSAIGDFNKVEELYCSNNVLNSIPSEIGNLNKLKTLHLDNNEIVSIPNELGQIECLTDLKLENNLIKKIYPGFSSLTNLQTLNLNDNSLVYLPTFLLDLKKLTTLCLSNNEFSFRNSTYQSPKMRRNEFYSIKSSRRATKLKDKVGRNKDSTSVEKLLSSGSDSSETKKRVEFINLVQQANEIDPGKEVLRKRRYSYKPVKKNHFSDSNAQLETDIPVAKFCFSMFNSLTTIDLSMNALLSIPSSLLDTRSLENVNLSMNSITIVSSNIGNLKNLKSLDLSYNIIGTIPNEISELKKLKDLNLANNKVTKLPESIGQLVGLKVLDISNNLVRSLPTSFGRLLNLKHLNLSTNAFKKFPLEATDLNQLEVLKMGYNLIETVPAEIIFMRSLTNLDLRKNSIKFFECSGLPKLTYLNLRGNKITKIPSSIAQLRNIKEINLGKNKIEEVPVEIESLSSVTYIDLQKNCLKHVPTSIFLLPHLRRLGLRQNPIENISKSIIENDITLSTIRLIQQHLFGTMKKMDTAQVCFCGIEGSGKTSLFHSLKYGKVKKKSKPTKGLDIEEWPMKINVNRKGKVKSVKCNILVKDFSGNSNLKIANRLFLNSNCLYIVVWSFTQPEKLSELEEWIKTIRNYVFNPSIIIVATHKDQVNDNSMFRSLKDQYQSVTCVKKVIQVNTLDGENMPLLQQTMNDIIINDLNIGILIPSSFLKLRSALKEKTSYASYIEMSEFNKICLRYGIGAEYQSTALNYLSSVGAIVDVGALTNGSFKAVIADIKWISKLLYKLLTYSSSEQGFIKHENLEKIWQGPMRHNYMTIVHRLEIGVDSDANSKTEKGTYANLSLLPGLLSKVQSSTSWPKAKVEEVVKVYKLDFVPAEFIGIFIARTSNTLRHCDIWRYGCVVKEPTDTSIDNDDDTVGRLEYTSTHESTIKVTTRGPKASHLNHLMSSIIDSIVSTWLTLNFKCNSYRVHFENNEPKIEYIRKSA